MSANFEGDFENWRRCVRERMVADPGLADTCCFDIQLKDKTSAPAANVSGFVQQFRKYDWPVDLALPKIYYDPRSLRAEPEKRAALHAKCVVVDEESAFFSSANFTDAAQNRNIEVGILLKNPAAARKLERYFRRLIETGALARAF